MSKKSVFCSATSRHQAGRIVDHLRTESFSRSDISVLFSDEGKTRELTQDHITKAPAGAFGGAGPGDFVGEPLGWIAGIDVLIMPGHGSFIAAGPLVAALSCAPGSGVAGALMGLGFSEMEARRYERELDNGNILLSVHTDDAGDIARAKDIFKQADAQNIITSGEAAAKAIPLSEYGSRGSAIAAASPSQVMVK